MKEKHIYIDESGSPKNTKSCVICFILFKDTYDFNNLSIEIKNFKYQRFKNMDIELHFNKESFATKRLFFKMLRKYDFNIYYYQTNYLDKKLTYNQYLINGIRKYIDIFTDSKIYIDGNVSKNNQLIQEIKNLFKSKKIKINLIKLIDSKNNILIQISDMCAGCIRRNSDRGNKEDKELFDLINKFIK